MSEHHATGTPVPFNYGDAQVRVVTVAGEPWFVLADLARVLEIADVSRLASRLDDGVRQARPIPDRMGRIQNATVVSEAGMYEVVIRSDKPEAAAFRRWITGTVLPEIRQTGSYSVAPALPVDRTELLARAVLEATAALEEKEQHIRELAPRAAVADELMNATGLLTLQELAKALGWGPNILFRDLRRLGVLQSNRLPYQRYAHHFEVKLGTYRHPKSGETMPTHRTYARPSAIPFLRRKLDQLEQTLDLEVAS